MLTLAGCKGSGELTHIVLYSVVLLSQKTRPDALLSVKFPEPKLPVKMLLGEEGRESEEKKVDLWGPRWLQVSLCSRWWKVLLDVLT